MVASGVDYVLAVKSNQPKLFEAQVDFFDDGMGHGFGRVPCAFHETVEKDHGRTETRRCWAFGQVDWLTPQQRRSKLSMVGMIESAREIDGEISMERRYYYIGSIPAEAKRVGHAVHTYWGVVNKLQWQLDGSFREDDGRARRGNFAQNLSIIRRIALHLLRQDVSRKRRRGCKKVWVSCRSRHEIHYAENLVMPSSMKGSDHLPSHRQPEFDNATRHKTASSAAIYSSMSEGKSLRLMSGGERTWIEACLVRAIALYLAQYSGRRYATLFSDESDGALDPERKRMFMAMKREALRLGGYEREFFITQTPALAAMADVVIDLGAMRFNARAQAEID
jgi:predicted transposase YbfD/YdcC